MGEVSKIAWTHATFNPWIGCQRVSPGCTNCYAEELATRRLKLPVWGGDAPRHVTADDYWRGPARWNRKAAAGFLPDGKTPLAPGERVRVFCASLADVFELPPARNVDAARAMSEARARLWPIIEQTTELDWLLLTKRPQNIFDLAPREWGRERPWPRNVWLGVTVEDRVRAEQRIPLLLRVPSVVRFVSYEPALEAVDFFPWVTTENERVYTRGAHVRGIDWLIIGGESGANARPFDLGWARAALRAAEGSTCAPFVKQLGDNCGQSSSESRRFGSLANLTARKGGEPDEWPHDLRVRRFPRPELAA